MVVTVIIPRPHPLLTCGGRGRWNDRTNQSIDPHNHTTMNTKHTPGPWTNTPMQDTIWANDGDTMVARIADLPWKETPSGRRTSDCETEYANARLIAAAPELLEALEATLPWLSLLGDFIGNGVMVDKMNHKTPVGPMGRCEAIAKVRDAIARATGE